MNIAETSFIASFSRMAANAYKRGWHERNGGNLSYRILDEEMASLSPYLAFPAAWRPLEFKAPVLAGQSFLITGKGSYMGELIRQPGQHTGIITIDASGSAYAVRWGLIHNGQPTSELATHLLSHASKIERTERVIYHAHPTNIIALSFVLPADEKKLSRILWSMMPECPMAFPQGVGVIPFMTPGGQEIAYVSARLMQTYNALLWARHGLFCAGEDFDKAFGLMETIEKAAQIYVTILSTGLDWQGPDIGFLRQLNHDLNLNMNTDLLQ